MIKELDFTQARRTCPDNFISCNSTMELEPLSEIIGQDRAVKALQFGLDIKEEGFNVYVAGLPGTGKKTLIINFLYLQIGVMFTILKTVKNQMLFAYLQEKDQSLSLTWINLLRI